MKKIITLFKVALAVANFSLVNSSLAQVAQKACSSLEVKVFLEGAYDVATGQMKSQLNSGCPILPGLTGSSINYGPLCPYFTVDTPVGQPYKVAPWFYAGTEGDAFNDFNATAPNPYPVDTIDWVLVSVRKNGITKAHEVFKQAALLLKDGRVQFVSADCFKPLPQNNYYIVVEHRSHLRAMSHKPLRVTGNKTIAPKISYDFTNHNSFHFGGTGQKKVGHKVFALVGGDLDQDGVIEFNGNDQTIWAGFNGIFSDYWQAADIDLNQDTNVTDQSFIINNNGVATDVPN